MNSSPNTCRPDGARRLADVDAFRVMDILARARALEAAGRDIIHLEIGEPDFATPEPILAAGIDALRRSLTHYTPALGLPALREAIAADYAERHGAHLPAARVAVTTGASGALVLALAALFDPGDEVLLADPGYPCNRHIARTLEVVGVGLPVGPESRYQLTAELVERHWGERTRGVLVANPGNPAGTIIDAAELRAIHAAVRRRGGWLLVDEIYHQLIYGAPQPSAVTLDDNVLVIGSFSKYHCMTGWRLGWLVAPEALMPGIDRLAQNLYLAAPTPAQHAALAAFHPDTRAILETRKQELRDRRDRLVPALTQLGLTVAGVPDGAFYVYAEIGRLGDDAEQLANHLLATAGVAVTPGLDFGHYRSHRHLRFAYTTPASRIDQALERIARCV